MTITDTGLKYKNIFILIKSLSRTYQANCSIIRHDGRYENRSVFTLWTVEPIRLQLM